MTTLYAVSVLVLFSLIVFLVLRLIRHKPNKSTKNHDLVVSRNDRDTNTPRNIGYGFMVVGATLLGIALFGIINYPQNMFFGFPLSFGALFFLLGLILLIGFNIQKLKAARNREGKIPKWFFVPLSIGIILCLTAALFMFLGISSIPARIVIFVVGSVLITISSVTSRAIKRKSLL